MVRVISHNFKLPYRGLGDGAAVFVGSEELAACRRNVIAVDFGRDSYGSESCLDSDGESKGTRTPSGSGNPQRHEKETKRKERRRERNKISAQAYRQRRREQGVEQQKMLKFLEIQHTELLEKVQRLEAEKNRVRQYLQSHPTHVFWPAT